jgi:hypothetical protein
MPEIMQRLIQTVCPNKWIDLDEIDIKFNEMEDEMGFPPKKRFRHLAGEYSTNTLVIERVWESLAELEKKMWKAYTNPSYAKLGAEIEGKLISEQKQELYLVL